MRLLACIALALALAAGAASSASAAAEACPGSGAGPCPYTAVQVIGQRGEGVLRFPEAVAVDTRGDVYVADQLGYVVQKFSAAGAFETQWGSYGGGHGQFGPIGGLAVDAADDVYVVDSSHNRIQKFGPDGEFITAWGHRGSELGRVRLRLLAEPQPAARRRHRGVGAVVYVADSGNNRIERFNLEGGEAIAWGTQGSGPGQFSYPRGVAANESEVVVADDDNHRIEKFGPEGAYQAEAGTPGRRAGAVRLSIRRRAGRRRRRIRGRRQQRPRRRAHAAAGVRRCVGRRRLQAGAVRVPARARQRPRRRHLRRGHRQRPHPGVQPRRRLPALVRRLRARAGQLTAPTGLAVDPSGRLLVSDTVDDRIETFAPGSDAFAGQWTLAGGHSAGYDSPAGIAVDPRGSVYVADPGNQRVVHLWGDDTYLGELGGPADLGGAELAAAGSVAVSPVTDQTYVADTDHNRVLVYGPEGTLQARWGAGEGDGAAGSGPGAFDHPEAVAAAPSGSVYVADTANDRVVELSLSGGVIAEWGAKDTPPAACARPPASPSTPPAACTWPTANTTASRCSKPTDASSPGGACAGPAPGELSQPTRRRGRLRRRRVRGRHQQQPRAALRPRRAGRTP